jgi:hypothetical protein
MIEGTLHLTLLSNNTVQFVFMPNTGSGNSRPLLAKNTGQAEYDLTHTWDFSPEKARAAIEELEKSRQVERRISIEEATVSFMFEAR